MTSLLGVINQCQWGPVVDRLLLLSLNFRVSGDSSGRKSMRLVVVGS